MTIDEAIAHAMEVAEKNECKMTSDDGYTDVSMKQCATEHRQLAEWLKELKKAKAMILDTSYTLEVMCDKVSTKIGCERCTYYDEETHGCEVRKWIDKMRTLCKGKKVV